MTEISTNSTIASKYLRVEKNSFSSGENTKYYQTPLDKHEIELAPRVEEENIVGVKKI